MTNPNRNKALIIVDAQRTFMPEAEGERLGVPGFGELAVPDGHTIVPVLNALTKVFRIHRMQVLTTADNHLEGTAHISTTPNFVTTWPRHGMQGTPGAELHPQLLANDPTIAAHFIKGDVIAKTPEEDDSYTGALAHRVDPETKLDTRLPNYLRENDITKVYVTGLTTSEGRKGAALCADQTAIDLHEQGFEVTFVHNAVKPLNEEQYPICLQNLGALGIRIATAEEAAQDVIHTPEIIR